jgi:hypothetical protein
MTTFPFRGVRSKFAVCVLAASAWFAPSAAADVWTVIPNGSGDFVQIQAAVDAAVDGDVLLVSPGTYAGFAIEEKSVWVLAVGGTVTVTNTVSIQNLTSNQSALLAGITVNAQTILDFPPPRTLRQAPGLSLANNVGHVRAQNCTFKGARGTTQYSELGNGGAGADIESCLSVAFSGCSFLGGNGRFACDFVWCGAPYARGGHGVRTNLSIAAFYACTLQGGVGDQAEADPPGNGGNGCDVPTFAIFASGTQFIGGQGGWMQNVHFSGGNGGDGVHVASGARAFLLDNSYTPGPAGFSSFGNHGNPGSTTAGGGIFNFWNEPKRLATSSILATSGGTLTVSFQGAPGDRVYLPTASTSHWQLVKVKFGVWLLPVPVRLDHTPVAILSPSGTATIQFPMPNLAAGESVRRAFAQAVFLSTQGQVVLGSPLHFAILN